MKKIRNLICFLFGHTGDTYDTYAHVCDRCKCHSYYEEDWYYRNLPAILNKVYWRIRNTWVCWTFKVRYKWLPIHGKCCDCRKTKWIFGKHIGNHDDCLPF